MAANAVQRLGARTGAIVSVSIGLVSFILGERFASKAVGIPAPKEG